MSNNFVSKKLDYPEDCIRISKVVLDKGYYINPLEAQTLWENYSDSCSASWLCLPYDDDEIWFSIRDYIC